MKDNNKTNVRRLKRRQPCAKACTTRLRAAAVGLGCLLAVGLMDMTGAHAGAGFWTRDVWVDPERPFLFYGEIKDDAKAPAARGTQEAKAAPSPAAVEGKMKPLSAYGTLVELKAERERRLEVAVMEPTTENVAAYLEINRFMTDKAAYFSEAWRDTLRLYPEFDWTVERPVVNRASTELAAQRDADIVATVANLPKDTWGLVFFGTNDRLTPLMWPLVEQFAALYALEVATVAVGGPVAALPKARIDTTLAARIGGRGLTRLPALVLVHRDDAGPEDARLVASGVVDVMELTRRVARIVTAGTKNNNAVLLTAMQGIKKDETQRD